MAFPSAHQKAAVAIPLPAGGAVPCSIALSSARARKMAGTDVAIGQTTHDAIASTSAITACVLGPW